LECTQSGSQLNEIPMPATIYLFRHGKVDKDKNYDILAPAGEEFRDWLPSFFQKRRVRLDSVFFDASDGAKRCVTTLDKVVCGSRTEYGPGRPHKTLNAVLGCLTAGQHAICCRGDSIESGQLYHVKDFDLHTPFSFSDHARKASDRMKSSYHVIYVLECTEGVWQQTDKIPMPPLERVMNS